MIEILRFAPAMRGLRNVVRGLINASESHALLSHVEDSVEGAPVLRIALRFNHSTFVGWLR